MKNTIQSLFTWLLLVVFVFTTKTFFAQTSACPSVNAGADQTVCSGPCLTLNAIIQGSVQTTSYVEQSIPYSPYSYTGGNSILLNIDDTWSGVIPLTFCFEFFGNTYNSIVIGSNAIITFDLTQANGYCQWPISAAIPSSGNPMNSIMAPWHDIDPSVPTSSSATDVNWKVIGNAPCREFVISWNDVAMFQCNAMVATSQLVLHETTNIIDIYIQDKPICSSWNGGAAIEGIQDATGTVAYDVPGRNFPAMWAATNDGQRFMPSGPPNYTIQWFDPNGPIATTDTVTVCPTTTTTYTATVTNASCAGPIIVSDQVTITINGSITSTSSSTNSSCSGNTGTASVTATGGSGNYTYLWNPSGQTTQTATGLASGSYTCTITDAASGCTSIQVVNVGNSGNLTATSTSTNSICNGGNNGTATVTPIGGSGIYTYNWAPVGGTSATATGLSQGTYTCTITDSNGCVFVQIVTITQPSAITATSTQVSPVCFGGTNGTATVNAFGGTPGYTYLWSPSGGNSATGTGLSAGTYTCTITDSNGCIGTQSVTITNPPPIVNNMTIVDIGCFATGSATTNVTGGTGPYTYLWSDLSTSSADYNLTVGTYTVLITDANGCTLIDTAIINSVNPMTSTQTFSNVTCFGANNGTATVIPSGGTSPYTYSWSPTGGNNATATGLTGGQYTVTITDANGCISTATITIIEPFQLTATATSSNVACNGGNDGSGSVIPTGGTPSYSYVWSPAGGTNQTANGLSAGNYSVTVTDSSGCITTQTLSITQPSLLSVNMNGDSACYGSPSQISANGVGGISPYTYSWSNGPTTQTQNVIITSTTTYTVTVTDAYGCTTTGISTVTVNPLPISSITSNAINGIFTVTPNGQLCFTGPSVGISAWNWTLQPGNSILQTACVTITASDTGTYCASLVVQNSYGCLDTATTCIEITDVYYSIPNVFTPNGDGTNDAFIISNHGMNSFHCMIYDRWGALIYEWNDATGNWDGKTSNGKEAVDGVYYWTLNMSDFAGKNYDEHGFVHLIRGK